MFMRTGKYLLALLCCMATHSAVGAEPAVLKQSDILPYVMQISTWHRRVVALEASETLARELLPKEALRQSASQVLHFGMQFAHIAAVDLSEGGNTPDTTAKDTDNSAIVKAAAAADQYAEQLQAQKQAAWITSPDYKALSDKLKLAQAQQAFYQSLLAVDKNTDVSSANTDINTLETLTHGAHDSKKTQPATPAAQETPPPNTSGIYGLASELYTIYRKRVDIDNFIAQSQHLSKNNQKMQDTLLGQLQQLAQGTPANADDNPLADYKKISPAVIPLRQINLWLDASIHHLHEWRDVIDHAQERMLSRLLMRLGVLLVAVMVPVLLSEIARRATLRYVQDVRRQQQLRTVRRVVFACVLTVVVVMNFATEFGSLATFAGFLTAGLAIALQNVILSFAAYFLFFGPFGIRVGERVTIAGVTGQVVQVGITRFYLMELKGSDFNLYPTGRLVAFPNSVLFQPSAFFKPIPGASFAWQEVNILLAPGAQYESVYKTLMDAVEKVYHDYDAAMKHQQKALERLTHSFVALPPAKGTLRFTDNGLALTIRYPIDSKHATELNDRITRIILDTVDKNAAMRFEGANPPWVESGVQEEQDTQSSR
jgi:small-conductance mechanosensitive channel